MSRITEKELVLPTLHLLSENPKGLSTSSLIDLLQNLFNPTGEDAEILAGRSDTKFSQKVRNLKSHNTLTDKGLAKYENETFKITAKGKKLIERDSNVTEYLFSNNFDYEDVKESLIKLSKGVIASKKAVLFDENAIINEGSLLDKKVKKTQRSLKLREFAISKFTKKDGIQCIACGFDFKKNYGSIGEGYIEIHHIKPIFSFADNDFEKTLADAVKNLVPLCANCHRMVHRQNKNQLTIKQLKKILKEQV